MRFLGRAVYVGAVAVLAAAMQHGPTEQRVARLAALLGINRRTLVRWRRWWSSTFRASRFWNPEEIRTRDVNLGKGISAA